jgi:hypothetical protein
VPIGTSAEKSVKFTRANARPSRRREPASGYSSHVAHSASALRCPTAPHVYPVDPSCGLHAPPNPAAIKLLDKAAGRGDLPERGKTRARPRARTGRASFD